MRTLLVLSSLFLLANSSAQANGMQLFPDFQKNLADMQESAQEFMSVNADIMRLTGQLAGAGPLDDAMNDAQLTAVTREFGPTIINLRDLPMKSEVAKTERPSWSSWWFPVFETTLFRNDGRDDSALEKYDDYRQSKFGGGLFGPSINKAAVWEEQNAYDSTAARWEGLCDAWAIAATLHPEPNQGFRLRKTNFYVGDLKALLIKTYDSVETNALKLYGERFQGTADSWIHPDIFPDQFHRFIEVQLFRNHKGFIMDHDPGVAVWTVPVHKANYSMEQDPNNPNQVIVRMFLYNAKQLTSADQRHALGTTEEIRQYAYVLSGDRNSQGQLVVKSGAWLNTQFARSRADHPDYFISVPNPEAIKRKSRNPEIDASIVDTILKNIE